MLIDTPDVAIRIGDAFFLMPTDEADEILEEVCNLVILACIA